MFNKEFPNLVNCLVEKEKDLSEKLKNVLTKSDYIDRKKYWEKIDKVDESYAHPYYIGFGNPEADILIIGKEKGFDINDKKLLFYESINNVYYWKLIVDGELEKMSGNTIDEKIIEFVKKYDFCPLFPLGLELYRHPIYIKTFRRGHTWKKYESIISKSYNLSFNYNTGSYHYSKSFFSRCFITEFNYIPAKNTNNNLDGLFNDRIKIFSDPFFKKFNVILFSATAYIRNNYESILKIVSNISSC